LETWGLATLTEPDVSRDLARIESAVELFRHWSPVKGALPDLIATAFRITRAEGTGRVLRGDPRELLAASVTGEVPAVFRLPDFIPGAVPFSGAIDLALRRYLAARLVAGWIVFQADDIRGVVRYLRLCLDTVLLFASSRDGSEIEERRWKESIRCADLWILHHCDPELLARNLG
jgi:hypothetical protein